LAAWTLLSQLKIVLENLITKNETPQKYNLLLLPEYTREIPKKLCAREYPKKNDICFSLVSGLETDVITHSRDVL